MLKRQIVILVAMMAGTAAYAEPDLTQLAGGGPARAASVGAPAAAGHPTVPAPHAGSPAATTNGKMTQESVDPFTGHTERYEQILQQERYFDALKRMLKNQVEAQALKTQLMLQPVRTELEIAKARQKISELTAPQPQAAPQPVAPEPPPAAPVVQKKPTPPKTSKHKRKQRIHYLGYIEEGGRRKALLRIAGKVREVSVGDKAGRYRVADVTEHEVVLKRGKRRVRLHRKDGDYRIEAPIQIASGSLPGGAGPIPGMGLDALQQMVMPADAGVVPVGSFGATPGPTPEPMGIVGGQ